MNQIHSVLASCCAAIATENALGLSEDKARSQPRLSIDRRGLFFVILRIYEVELLGAYDFGDLASPLPLGFGVFGLKFSCLEQFNGWGARRSIRFMEFFAA